MAALLRSGKLLRVVSGLARSPAAAPPQAPGGGGVPCLSLAASEGQQQQQQQQWVVPSLDLGHSHGATYTAWSMQLLESALPSVAAGADPKGEDNTDRQEIENLNIPHHVTKSEVLSLLRRIPSLEGKAAASTSVLVLRLCGSVLAQDVESTTERTELVNAIWTELEETMGIPMGVDHYNALLAVYLQNGHEFCPDHVQSRLRKQSVSPNRETFEALLERYCQEGDIDGANRILKVMHENGYKASRNVFHKLILGHNKRTDAASNALDIVPVMVQYNVEPNKDTYHALCQGFAQQGNAGAIKHAAREAEKVGTPLDTTKLLDLIFEMAASGSQTDVSDILSLVSTEADGFHGAVEGLVLRLIRHGHEEVAFSVLQELPGGQEERAKSLLDELVSLRRPVSKLLWYVEEMKRRKVMVNATEYILHAALRKRNFSLALKLAEIHVQDGNQMSEEDALSLLKLCGNTIDVVSTVKAIGGDSICNSALKDIVIPSFEKVSHNTESLIESLEMAGIPFERFMNPLMDYLTHEGREEDVKIIEEKLNPAKAPVVSPPIDYRSSNASELSAAVSDSSQASSMLVFSPPMTPSPEVQDPGTQLFKEGCKGDQQQQAPILSPMVQMYDPSSSVYQWVPLVSMCSMFLSQGQYWELEQLLWASNGSYAPEDRKQIYLFTLKSFAQQGLYDKAIHLASQLESEGLAYGFTEFHQVMSEFGENYMPASTDPVPWSLGEDKLVMPSVSPASTPSIISTLPAASTPAPAQPSSADSDLVSFHHKGLKQALAEANAEAALQSYHELERLRKPLNVTESSALIEVLLKNELVSAATDVTKTMLERDAYPMPKIFRFLLNRLAAIGDVDGITFIGNHLSPKVKKEVSFDNRLCNAYLSASRGEEFLSLLERDLARADSSTIQSIKDRFPRGGAMGLLENNPHLLKQYSKLAHDFVRYDYVAPINVLWTYYFIQGRQDLALPLWNKYVKDCPQIMFQKVCQTARANEDIKMAAGLVNLLHDANVTSGAKGIAYSCLLDVESAKSEYVRGLARLRDGMKRGVQIEDINRTALVRIKTGLEKQGLSFPYEIPKKRPGQDLDSVHAERCTSPISAV